MHTFRTRGRAARVALVQAIACGGALALLTSSAPPAASASAPVVAPVALTTTTEPATTSNTVTSTANTGIASTTSGPTVTTTGATSPVTTTADTTTSSTGAASLTNTSASGSTAAGVVVIGSPDVSGETDALPSTTEVVTALRAFVDSCGFGSILSVSSFAPGCGPLVQQAIQTIKDLMSGIGTIDCDDSSTTCGHAKEYLLALAGDVNTCLGTGPIGNLATRANLVEACNDAVALIESARTFALACLARADATCDTALTLATGVATVAGTCVSDVGSAFGVGTVSTTYTTGGDHTCAGVAAALADTVHATLDMVNACKRGDTGTPCRALTDLATTVATLVGGCAHDTLHAFGLDLVVLPLNGQTVCATVADNAAAGLAAAVALVTGCAAGTDATCEGLVRSATELGTAVGACATALVAGRPSTTDTLHCGTAIDDSMDMFDSTVGIECLGGSPNTHVAPTDPADMQAILADAGVLSDVSTPPDEEELTSLYDAAAIQISVLDCVDHILSVNPVNADARMDGASFWNDVPSDGTPLPKPTDDNPSSTGSDAPSTSNFKYPPLNGAAGDTYGKNIKEGKGTSFGAHWWMYETKIKDYRGRTLVVWQNADVSVVDEDSIKFNKAIAGVHQEGGGNAYFAGSGPLGEDNIEDRQTMHVHIGIDGKSKDDDKENGWNASLDRDILVEHTKFGGGNLRDNNGDNYMHYGGYRKITRGYRHQGRFWSEGGGWVFGKNAYQGFQIGVQVAYVTK